MIGIHNLVYEVGAFRLELSLDIRKGEYFVIMGSTGSGKTALIECLAGLRRPLSGTIEIFGRDTTGLEPRQRMIGYVPQDYALFTNRTVRGNVAFGPEVRRWPHAEIERAVKDAARLVGIEPLLDRRIAGLSGGERQRVALARAIVTRPEVLILDEPVSALDESTREQVCGELRRLQRELGVTTIHVSHSLEEAFSVADRAAVMRGGRLDQVGRIEDLLRHPQDEIVARFMRCENIFSGDSVGEGVLQNTTRVKVKDVEIVVPGRRQGQVAFVIRPENVVVRRQADGGGNAGVTVLPARVVRAVDRGVYVSVELESFQRLVAYMSADDFGRLGGVEGLDVKVVIQPDGVHVLPVTGA
jgi:ABC-type Fe3+/spermidine/putrescine transport system ATPase subunit